MQCNEVWARSYLTELGSSMDILLDGLEDSAISLEESAIGTAATAMQFRRARRVREVDDCR